MPQKGGLGLGELTTNCSKPVEGVAKGVHVGVTTMSATIYLTQGLSFLPYPFITW